ncbi:MAG: phage antirepressor N-terminal domain-containing protein [Moraxellaceae bacterium]
MTSAITVPFYGSELFVVDHKGQPYTPMKTIVESIGLDWASQYTKLKQRFASTIVEIAMVANDGKERLMTCLPLRKLFGWLMSISPNKIPNLDVRAKVVMYQNECDDVLWDYWTKGQAINKRLTISPEQQAELHNIVEDRAGNNRKVFAEMWSRHNRHFKVAKYNQLLAVHFEDAKQYLASMELRSKLELAVVPQDAFSMMFSETRHQVADYMHRLQKQVIDLGGTLPSYPAFDNDAIAATVIGSIVQSRRMFLTFGMDGKPNVSFIPSDCYVIRDEDFPKVIADREGVNKSLLPDIMQSVMKRLGLANK